jgi:hypothetical protein
MAKKPKQPSFIKQAWNLMVERSHTRKALRLLSKQEWSIDFLTAMLIRASNVTRQSYEMEIHGPHGTKIVIRTIDAPTNSAYRDESIFNHLDDELKVKQFIESVNKR